MNQKMMFSPTKFDLFSSSLKKRACQTRYVVDPPTPSLENGGEEFETGITFETFHRIEDGIIGGVVCYYAVCSVQPSRKGRRESRGTVWCVFGRWWREQ